MAPQGLIARSPIFSIQTGVSKLTEKAKRVGCPECGAFVKSHNLNAHMKEVHKIKRKTSEQGRSRGDSKRTKGKSPRGGGVGFPWRLIVVGIVVLTMIGSILVIRPGSPPAPDGNGSIPAECVQGKTLVVNFDVKLHLYVTDPATHKNNFTHLIPNDLGKDPIDGQACTRSLSTGSASEYNASSQDAVIHVQSPEAKNFTLGDFFLLWSGQTLEPGKVASYWTNYGWRIVMKVNGAVVADTNVNPLYAYAALKLAPNQNIDFYVSK